MGFFKKIFSREKKEKLDSGLQKSKEGVLGKITRAIAGKSKVDDEVLDNLEEAFITSDVGVDTTLKIINRLEERVARDKYVNTAELNTTGVRGASDTFRAASIPQLEIWGERVGVPVVKQAMGSDPAAVAYDTVESAKAHGADVVIIDTAGRLHNKVGLMNELTKIKNVMKRVAPTAPDEILLVLDGSTGQNAFEQARQFVAATEVNCLAITKLDGTAKGGVVLGISDQFKIPVKYIGIGEGIEDIQIFRPEEFVKSLFLNE